MYTHQTKQKSIEMGVTLIAFNFQRLLTQIVPSRTVMYVVCPKSKGTDFPMDELVM